MNKKKPTILVDLLPALEGFAGIPQEARLLFKVLAQQSTLETAGLIHTNHTFSLKYNFGGKGQDKRDDLITCANFLAELTYSTMKKDQLPQSIIRKVLNRYQQLKDIIPLLTTRDFPMKEIDGEHFFGALWRLLFSKTLTAEDIALLIKQRYFISSLNSRSMRVAAKLKSSVTLDTKGCDFAIFQFMRPVNVSPGTTKMIRYHDSIALQDSDVCVPNGSFTQGTDLIKCLKDSFYVCNSEPTRESLLNLAPELESKSTTIGLILANYTKSLHRKTLLSIIRRGFSSLLLTSDKQVAVYNELKAQPDFPYILIIATLEPRKNYEMLIRAWEKLRAQNKINHRLVIVGNTGWSNANIVNAMRPHVADGEILHLEKILPEDMGYLYSHASCFVFPSYNEGFGCPPLEAMQCECPVIVSDIKTHRWVLGDAALYCNPYDVNSLSDQLEYLLVSPEADHVRQALIAKGLERVKLYSPEVIGEQWTALFNNLKVKGKASV